MRNRLGTGSTAMQSGCVDARNAVPPGVQKADRCNAVEEDLIGVNHPQQAMHVL